jgi:LPXTG-motif cell wall-anchored protein
MASGQAAAPAAVQVPAALPRTGDVATPSAWGAGLAGALLVLAGVALRRRTHA